MPASHHATHQGLQSHSLGGSYPWTISGIGDDWYAWNMITGEGSPGSPAFKRRADYSVAIDDIPEPFRSAEKRCELQADRSRRRRNRDREEFADIDDALADYHAS